MLSKGEIDSKNIRVAFSLEDMDMSEFQDGAAYYDRRNAGAYSQKARIHNLKKMNALFYYLMENGIHDLNTLEKCVRVLRESSDVLKTKPDSRTALLFSVLVPRNW